jgi:hypothetical protein
VTPRTVWISLLACLVAVNSASGQTTTQKRPSSKYRTILTIAGAGGGFALGVLGGMAAYDDATYASRKIWTMAIVTGAAGGVGGYFLGRTLDRSSSGTAWAPRYIPDELDRCLWLAGRRKREFTASLPQPAVFPPNASPLKDDHPVCAQAGPAYNLSGR